MVHALPPSAQRKLGEYKRQGPRSGFEIGGGEGGGGTFVTRYWGGGHKTPFLSNSL